MNRERATVLFARALGIRPTAQPDLSGFVDGKDAADWSAGYIDAMAKDGIIQGVGNQTLALGSSITRGSVVKILDSSVAEYAVEEGATIDQDVDGILLVAADDITVDGAAVSGQSACSPQSRRGQSDREERQAGAGSAGFHPRRHPDCGRFPGGGRRGPLR